MTLPPYSWVHAPRKPRRSYARPLWFAGLFVGLILSAALALPPWEARTPLALIEGEQP